MVMRLVQSAFTGFIYSGLIFVLSGCGTLYTNKTEVRNLPSEVEDKLSLGDTRKKVHSLLGEPLIEAQSLGLEVYRESARDIGFIIPFTPVPGVRVSAVILLIYDDNEVVKDFATGLWDSKYQAASDELWITAGGFSFVNVSSTIPPDILLAPPIPWENLTAMTTTEDKCMLVLLMGECPMDVVSLDGKEITDLWPAGFYCEGWEQRQHNLYGTFIRRYITPGHHQLTINQKSLQGEFETNFECKRGETVYAELRANTTQDAWGERTGVEGSIIMSKTPSESALQMRELRAILWHQGVWIESPINPMAK
jgi:hypothetical protein